MLRGNVNVNLMFLKNTRLNFPDVSSGAVKKPAPEIGGRLHFW